MLVLTRRQHQLVHIGPDIGVFVMAVQGGNVRLGIVAPRNVRILRDELVPDGLLLPAAVHAERMREQGARRFVRRTYAAA